MRAAAACLLAPILAGAGPSERELLLSSLAARERDGVEEASGGLARLPVYRLEVEAIPAKRRISGRAQIEWTWPGPGPAGELYLRLWPNAAWSAGAGALRVSDVRVGGKAVKTSARGATLLRVPLSEPLAAGARATVDLRFEGRVPKADEGADDLLAQAFAQLGALTGGGGAASDHGTFAASADTMMLAGFYPVVARCDEGRWDLDEPGGMGDAADAGPANVVLSVLMPAGFRAVATGVEVGSHPEAKGRVRSTFVAAAVREAGLVVSSRLSVESARAGEVEVRSWFRAEDEDAGLHALSAAKDALAFYARTFGPYPWADLDVVESGLTGGAGGVELPGAVWIASMFYRDPAGLPALASGTLAVPEVLEFAVAHEVAHQWWHAMVGSDSRGAPEVDEALAQYSALLYIESARGPEAMAEARELQVALNYRVMRMMGGADAAVARPASAYHGMLDYAGLIYGKAPLFYEAARKLLGDELFFKALKTYARRFRFREAPRDGFYIAVEEVAPGRGEEVLGLWKRWMQERHGDEDVGVVTMDELAGSFGAMRRDPFGGTGTDADADAALRDMQPLLEQLMKELRAAQRGP